VLNILIFVLLPGSCFNVRTWISELNVFTFFVVLILVLFLGLFPASQHILTILTSSRALWCST